ncbi:hypothetical protein KSX_47020 [Ktedonospora formicarum]|uniref:Uncharacterized protein n=1 Tax=Ktedonospora formicarum TaxID=2778364 RepID=A0A8J3I8B3_9CHLR|nr:hypothetical protein KSX_47020 [Ktedonospora formicarum]
MKILETLEERRAMRKGPPSVTHETCGEHSNVIVVVGHGVDSP